MDFPFQTYHNINGDYFATIDEAKALGFDRDQIWSVLEEDGFYTYGPSFHWINLLGYVATTQRHDSETYYNEDNLIEDNFNA